MASLIKDFVWIPSIISVILTFLVVLIIALVYQFKLKTLKGDEVPKGICFVIDQFVSWCVATTVEVGGAKMKKMAPYFCFLIVYITINNLVALLGFSTSTTNLTVPLALATITFFGLFIFAIKYRNKGFFKEYLNPITWVTQFSPLISLTLRLFGNLLSGVVILGLLYGVTNTLWQGVPVLGQINILGGFLAPPFHFYFDIFQGILQSYVFALLTISYWAQASESESPKNKIEQTNTNEKIQTNKNEKTNMKVYNIKKS